jgi:hypothetical protein
VRAAPARDTPSRRATSAGTTSRARHLRKRRRGRARRRGAACFAPVMASGPRRRAPGSSPSGHGASQRQAQLCPRQPCANMNASCSDGSSARVVSLMRRGASRWAGQCSWALRLPAHYQHNPRMLCAGPGPSPAFCWAGERRRRTLQRRLLRRRQVRPLLPVRRPPRTPARTCSVEAINLKRA